MKIVKFKDGTFGVRRFNLFCGYEFKSRANNDYWWKLGDKYFPNCKGTLDEARETYWKLKDKGTPYSGVTS